MPSVNSRDNSDRYWRSLAQLDDTPEFRALAESEFPEVATGGGMTRRRWLQLMGASFALAAANGCRWPKDEIVPFTERPANRVPGTPQQFATAMDRAGGALGLHVTSIDGRPIKIEGNPQHPASLGATDALAQAAILQLYDPDRSRSVLQAAGPKTFRRSWDEFRDFLRVHITARRRTQGRGFRILSEASSSPTLAAMRAELLQAFPQARWYEYEAVSRDNERTGAILASGKPIRTRLSLNKANVIVCFDDDLLAGHPAAIRHTREFSKRRDPAAGSMNRLYTVESRFSVTGAAADHRLPSRSMDIPAAVTWLDRAIQEVLQTMKAPTPLAKRSPTEAQFFMAVLGDLLENRGRSVVTAGPSQPAEVHAAVHRINAALGNIGRAIVCSADPEPERLSHVDAIRSVVEDMDAGDVSTLLILGGNPVYDAPADLAFAQALQNVETRMHLSPYRDETSLQCHWHLPQAHFLESWGDARADDGTYSVVQPLIEPIHGGKSSLQVLAMSLGDEAFDARARVRATFDRIAEGDGLDARWRQTLHDGLLQDSQSPAVPVSAAAAESPGVAESVGDQDEQLEVVFHADAKVLDGRYANSGWLQEMPEPMTRLTWGNAAVMSPATAKALGVENETVVKLKRGGRTLEIPAYAMPGQADGSIAISLGYGRRAAGRVGGSDRDGVVPVGADAYRFRTSDAMELASGLTVEPTGQKSPLASTQEHFAIDTVGMKVREERANRLVREATSSSYEQYQSLSAAEREKIDITGHQVHHPPLESLWEEPPFDKADHRWGMAIDLSKCIGCGACVLACQAENNIPIVGKEQVLRNREMHWIRVDRYFKGDPQNPQVAMQPVACHHCELAPCEQVCPAAATVHSDEGLNDMIYNRCVGTRYCGNNCPYKVRRFNYFNYHKFLEDPQSEIAKMLFNPEVTVRHRGVMEKCTYCVQRIQAAKIPAKNANQPIEDGTIQTACQQVCPADAIVFGDLADQNSQVAHAHRSVRAYGLLAELNIKPRTAYLARIRNPNPELEDETAGHPAHSEGESHGQS